MNIEKYKKLYEEYQAGSTLKEIAERHKMSISNISVSFQLMGLPTRGKGNKSFKNIDKTKVYQCYIENCSFTETASKFGISKQRVSEIITFIKKKGVT